MNKRENFDDYFGVFWSFCKINEFFIIKKVYLICFIFGYFNKIFKMMIFIIFVVTWIFQQIINIIVILSGFLFRENQGVIVDNIWVIMF